LADDIGQRMDVQIDGRTGAFVGKGDIVFWEYLRDRDRRQLNSYLYAGWLIREGIPFAQSIDDFLDRHRSNEIANTLGKAMIIKTILEAERVARCISISLLIQRQNFSQASSLTRGL